MVGDRSGVRCGEEEVEDGESGAADDEQAGGGRHGIYFGTNIE